MYTALVKALVVNLAVNDPRPPPLARPLPFIEVAQVGIVTETADKMEAVLADASVEGSILEESVCNDEMRQPQQFFAVTLDDPDVMLSE